MAKPPPKAISSVRRLARSAIYSRRHHPGASSLPQCGPQVLGANLKCSESRYGLATNALATGRPECLYLGPQPLGAWSSAPSDPPPLAAGVDATSAARIAPAHGCTGIDELEECRPRAWPVNSSSASGTSRSIPPGPSSSEAWRHGSRHFFDPKPAAEARSRSRSIGGLLARVSLATVHMLS